MTKFCKDCKWYKNNDNWGMGYDHHDQCLCPEIQPGPNLVTGRIPRAFCRMERLSNGKCGVEGKFWEPKPPKEIKDQFWNRVFNFGANKQFQK